MSQALIDELQQENLCTHYILPLLKLSKFSFNSAGFINCFLTTDLKKVVVKVADKILLSRTIFCHPDFCGLYLDDDDMFLLVFTIRGKWGKDLELFKEGKYSQLSKQAKEYIIRYSRLANRIKVHGKAPRTDGRLLALEKHGILREMWKRVLYDNTGKSIDDAEEYLPEEYLSSPGKESFIVLQNLKRIREYE